MKQAVVIDCAVCHEMQTTDAGWFLLIENRWTDRLRIFRFERLRAEQPGTYSVCCVAHLRELVVHWMTIGRLDVPFASISGSSGRARRPQTFFRELRKETGQTAAPVVSSDDLVGELAVHRETLTRVLRENPQALTSVLEALIREAAPTGVRPSVSPVTGTSATELSDRVLA